MVLMTAIGLSVCAWASAIPAIILSQPVAFERTGVARGVADAGDDVDARRCGQQRRDVAVDLRDCPSRRR